jgi:transcriptional/translational regulatory protein YebC/TACO1
MFNEKGVIIIDSDTISEDALMEHVLESGAEDVKSDDGSFQVTSIAKDFISVQEYFDEHGIAYESAEIARIPQTTIKVLEKDVKTLMKLINALEESDDVQKVWANFDIDDSLLEDLEV